MKAVLDTSVVVATGVGRLEGDLAVSTATLAELHFGVLVAKEASTRAERLRRLSVVEQRFEPLPVDEGVARSYGRLAAAVVQAGRKPRPRVMDLLIAATAHANGARLYTANPDDLRGLEAELDISAIPAPATKSRSAR